MSKLFTKLAAVQKELKSIPENGFNKFHSYKYSTSEDIINTVRPLCAEAGLVVSIGCTSQEIQRDGKAAFVIIQLTVTDSESGESTSCLMPGYAEDAKSDKSLYKAITGATKYALRNFFCLATGDDPEKDEPDRSAPKPASNPLMDQTTAELKRLGWGNEKGKMYLAENFGGKTARSQLTEVELSQFFNQLKAMPTPVLQDTRS